MPVGFDDRELVASGTEVGLDDVLGDHTRCAAGEWDPGQLSGVLALLTDQNEREIAVRGDRGKTCVGNSQRPRVGAVDAHGVDLRDVVTPPGGGKDDALAVGS